MSANNNTAFRAAHPIDFDLFDKDSQNVLYIEDNSDQLLTLHLQNASGQDIVLKDLKEPLSATNYHFALRFRPGTLSNTSLNGSKIIQLTNHSLKGNWEMLLGQHNSEHWDVIYLRKKGELLLKSATSITEAPRQAVEFKHVGAEAGQGARGTRVQLICANMNYQGSNELINTSREIHLSIINHRGKKHIPLQPGFTKGNTIVNDGVTNNQLTLRVANIGHYDQLNPTRSNITFRHDTDATKTTKLILSFQTGTENDEWALISENDVSEIEIDLGGWSVQKEMLGEKTVWVLLPKKTIHLPAMADPVSGANSHFDINIKDIVSDFPCGQTHLYIHYYNIPGYWDGHMACVIEKTPVKLKQGQLEIHAGSADAVPVNIVAMPEKSVSLIGFMMQSKSGEQTQSLVMGTSGNENKIESFNRPLLITNKGAGSSEMQVARFTADGKVGIGNITQPSAIIDLAAVKSVPALQLRNGNIVYHNSETQIVFGSNESNDRGAFFGHAIKTRHTSGDSNLNAIDFHVWTQEDQVNAIGSKHTLTLSNGKIGVGGITHPQAVVDIGNPDKRIPGLQILKGNAHSENDQSQIALGFHGAAGNQQADAYRHVIKTRHNGGEGAGNAIDFYVYKNGMNANFEGALHTMSLNSGKVGVGGIKDPHATLDVEGDIKCKGTGDGINSVGLTVAGGNIWSQYAHGGLLVGTNKQGFFGMHPDGDIGISTPGVGGWALTCKGKSGVNEITIHGKLYIHRVDSNGNKKGEVKHLFCNMSTKEVVYDASDRRLKKNISPLPYALETIQQLQGVSYQWNEEGLLHKTKDVEENYRAASNTPEDNARLWEQEKQRIRAEHARTFHGFIAQEVEAVFPEWVKEDEEGYKTINIDELAPVMVEAIKSQQQQITTMQAQIEFLMKEVAALKGGMVK